MAIIFDNIDITGLRNVHFKQLLNLVLDNESEGGYYGNREQYYKRQQELKTWLQWAVRYSERNDVIIPKHKSDKNENKKTRTDCRPRTSKAGAGK